MAARHRRCNAATHSCTVGLSVPYTHSSSGHQTSPLTLFVSASSASQTVIKTPTGMWKVQPRSGQTHPLNSWVLVLLKLLLPPSFPLAPSIIALSSAPVHSWTLPASVSVEIQVTVSLPIPQNRKKNRTNCKSSNLLQQMCPNTRSKTEADAVKGVPKSWKEQTQTWKH